MAGQRVQFVGVNCDDNLERATKVLAQQKVSGPSYKDGRYGPIRALWNVDGWPTIIILDQNGIIRDRDLRSWDLVKSVNKLLQE